MERLLKINGTIVRLEGRLIAVLLVCMSVLAVLQVITRYVFVYSILWLEELTRYMMVWLTLIGASVALSQNDNIRIDVLPLIFRQKLGVNFYPLINCVELAFSLVAAWYSLELVLYTNQSGQLSPAMRLPMACVYSSFLAGSLLMIFHSVVNLLQAFCGKREVRS